MANTSNKYQIIASVLMAIAIAIGAFGAHILNPGLEDKYIRTLQTANIYFVIHALAIYIISKGEHHIARQKKLALNFLIAGIALFSGSLYWIVLCKYTGTDIPFFVGPLTPLGGTSFILGWSVLAFYHIREN